MARSGVSSQFILTLQELITPAPPNRHFRDLLIDWLPHSNQRIRDLRDLGLARGSIRRYIYLHTDLGGKDKIMTIRVKKLPQKSVNQDELTSLLALALLCDNLNDAMPESKAPGSGWLRWGDAIAAGQKARRAEKSVN